MDVLCKTVKFVVAMMYVISVIVGMCLILLVIILSV